jgi:hypothetical protein
MMPLAITSAAVKDAAVHHDVTETTAVPGLCCEVTTEPEHCWVALQTSLVACRRAGDYLSKVAWRAGIPLEKFMLDNTAIVKDLEAPLQGTSLLLCPWLGIKSNWN